MQQTLEKSAYFTENHPSERINIKNSRKNVAKCRSMWPSRNTKEKAIASQANQGTKLDPEQFVCYLTNLQ